MPKKRPNIEKSFQCSISGCSRIFSSIEDRNWHVFNDNHEVKDSKCRYCDLSVYSITQDEYLQHLETHKQFGCEQCDMKFASNQILIKHYHDVHTKIIKCDKCSKMFWTQQKLDMHHKHVFPTFKCRKCPRMLTTEYRRNRHEINVHNAIDIHPIYNSAILPDGHRESDLNRVLEDCTLRVGGDRIPNGVGREVYDRSERLGSSDPSDQIKCNICEITFVTKYGKRQHIMSIHDKIKYECNICHVKYTSSWYLKIHIQNTHTTNNKTKCQTCNKTFAIQSALHRHYIRFPMHFPNHSI